MLQHKHIIWLMALLCCLAALSPFPSYRKAGVCDPPTRRRKDWSFKIELRRYRSADCGNAGRDETQMIGGPGKRWEIEQGQCKSWSDEAWAGFGYTWATNAARGWDCEASYGYCYGVLYAGENCSTPIRKTVQLNKLESMEMCFPVIDARGSAKAKSFRLICDGQE